MQAEQSPFLEGTNIQYAWDSTSFTTAMACPRRYLYASIYGYQSKSPDTAVALTFGQLLHAGVEQYHRLRAGETGYSEAVVGALRHVSSIPSDANIPLVDTLPVDADIQQLKEEAAEDDEDDGMDLRNSKIRTRYHLFRALTWYFENYRQDALEVVKLSTGAAAVEHSFRVPLDIKLESGAQLMLSGHYDKLVRFNGETFITDVKTTKALTRSWRSTFDLSHQMTGYTLSGILGLHEPVRGVWIDAVQLQVGGVQFARFTTSRSDSQLREYLQQLEYTAKLAEGWYNSQYYPMNTDACFLCRFKDICRQPPEFRQAYLDTYYVRKPTWNPLRNR